MPRSFLLSRGIGHKIQSLPVDSSGFLDKSLLCAQREKFVGEVISLLLPCRYFGRKRTMLMKVDLLSKEELLLEVKLRGVDPKPNSVVVELRKRLIHLIKLKAVPNVVHIKGKINYKDEIESVKEQLYVLSERLEESLELKNTLDILRRKSKLKHWQRRLDILSRVLKPEVIQSKVIEKLHEKFKLALAKFEEAQIDEEDTSKAIRKLSESNQELEEGLDSVPTVGSLEGERKRVENEVFMPNRDTNVFGKLAIPVERYLKNLKIYYGLNVIQLLEFLRVLLKMKGETQLSDKAILEIITGNCTGPLLNKVVEYKRVGYTVSQVHQNKISTFLPFTQLERLKFELVHRPLRHNETFSSYIIDVKESVKLLCFDIEERGIVEIVKVGMNPETRNKLVFVGNPTTFSELDEICIKIQNVSYADYMRRNDRPYQQSRRPEVQVHQKQLSDKRVICYVLRGQVILPVIST
ncbi:hypothetical protein J6590_088730 [Homalodisca vitripennis]|nr:hypothetical protein J6590_088730 [Homalodisca vitripennis]